GRGAGGSARRGRGRRATRGSPGGAGPRAARGGRSRRCGGGTWGRSAIVRRAGRPVPDPRRARDRAAPGRCAGGVARLKTPARRAGHDGRRAARGGRTADRALLEPVLPELVGECAGGELQELGGAGGVPLGALERPRDELALEGGEAAPDREVVVGARDGRGGGEEVRG